MFFIFCVSMLAETNRHPFDLPEAEAELVSGYNVEYSAMTFALFFLGEYANMLPGDRSERIRTYNFPQGRMTDHRINLTLYRLDQILAGDLDEIVDALTADAQAAMLAELNG
mgnify:CR=1 FL=1